MYVLPCGAKCPYHFIAPHSFANGSDAFWVKPVFLIRAGYASQTYIQSTLQIQDKQNNTKSKQKINTNKQESNKQKKKLK